MSFTGNPKGARIGVLALVVLTLWLACVSRKARADEPTFFASGGEMLLSNRPLASGLHLGMDLGPWQVSLQTHGEGSYGDRALSYLIEPNLGACGTWNVERKRWRIGWGACLWEHGDFSIGDANEISYQDGVVRLIDDDVALTAAISVRRTLGPGNRVFVEWFHASTGGSTHYNRGRNFFGAGMQF